MKTAHTEAWNICDGLRDELIRDGSTTVFNTVEEKLAEAIAAAREEGAKAMQEQILKKVRARARFSSKCVKTIEEIADDLESLDPATVVGGGE